MTFLKIFKPDLQSCHGIAMKLVTMLKRPDVDILTDVGTVHAGTQPLAEQPLGEPPYPRAHASKHGPKCLFATLPGLGQQTRQFFVVVHGDPRNGRWLTARDRIDATRIRAATGSTLFPG